MNTNRRTASTNSFLSIAILFLTALLLGGMIPLMSDTNLLMWGLITSVTFLSITLLDKNEPTSLWNIVCAIGFAGAMSIAMANLISEEPTWRGLHEGIEAKPVLVRALVVLLLFLIAGRIGYRQGQVLVNRPLLMPLIDLDSHPRFYTFVALFGLIPFGIVVRLLLLTKRLGGVDTALTALANREYQGHILTNAGSGVLVILANLAVGGVLLLLFSAKTKREWFLMSLIALGVVFVHMWTGRRTDVLPLLLAVLFSHHYKIRRVKFGYWVLLGAGLYMIMTALLVGRLYLSGVYVQPMFSEPARFFVKTLNLGIGGSFDGFLQVIAEENGFGIRAWSFETWFSFLWVLFPRVLFPWKPKYIPIGKLVKGFYVAPSPDFDFKSGVAPTILTTLYLNAGYVGIVLGMLLIGIVLGFLDKHLLKCERADGWMLHLVAWMLVFILFRTGDLTAAISQVIALFGGLAVAVISIVFLGRVDPVYPA